MFITLVVAVVPVLLVEVRAEMVVEVLVGLVMVRRVVMEQQTQGVAVVAEATAHQVQQVDRVLLC